ncbi:MAG: hypothetical protein JG773_1112 [Spirochaeta sp.]|uniref:hypothetical protein n=1 Tax=Sphaerochaeta sp. TaxID=1972642 RepID=UPI003D0B3B09|nr:hypothetical protein [Spirochaeta sp.]
MRACHHCHTPIDPLLSIGYHTVCPTCSKSLHSCVNCRFYSPGLYHDCLEGVEEYIEDKENANFCDSFMLGEDSKEESEKKARAKERAEALFNF